MSVISGQRGFSQPEYRVLSITPRQCISTYYPPTSAEWSNAAPRKISKSRQNKLKSGDKVWFRWQIQHASAGLHPTAGDWSLRAGVLHTLPPPRGHELGRLLAGPQRGAREVQIILNYLNMS